jgi:hypothetical protein
MAATAMTIIEPAGIDQTEPLHGLRQVGKSCSQQKVVMVRHEHKGEDVHLKPIGHFSNGFQEQCFVFIPIKNLLPIVSP